MEFDESKVYTALTADKLKIGSKVIVANTIDELKQYVEDDCCISTIECIQPEYCSDRFTSCHKYYNLAYLIEESKEIYYVGYDLQQEMLTWSFENNYFKHVYYECNTLKEAGDWIIKHRKFEPIMRAYELGKQIQFKSLVDGTWCDCDIMECLWMNNYEYRIKPEYKRMTNLDLAKWLAKGNGQVKVTENSVLTSWSYGIYDNAYITDKNVTIREWGGDWHEPLLEVETE